MKTSIWYHTLDQQPDKSGYYLSYRGWGLGGKGDGDSDHGYVYYDKKMNEWRDYQSTSMGHGAIVYYWTDATPDDWVENDTPLFKRQQQLDHMAPAEKEAWDNVQEAIKKYEVIKALCAK